MPRVYDVNTRSDLVFGVVWDLILRSGFEGVTLRKVAEDAGLSLSSLRHQFVDKERLLFLAMAEVQRRQERRERQALHRPRGPSPRSELDTFLELRLPLDPERHRECSVWLACVQRTERNQAMAELAACASISGFLFLKYLLRANGSDDEFDVMHLEALMAGLTLRLCDQYVPMEPDLAREILAAHLDRLEATGGEVCCDGSASG